MILSGLSCKSVRLKSCLPDTACSSGLLMIDTPVIPKAIELDPNTASFYLQLANGNQIVILQALIESYEGIGSVRTIDISESLVAVITPKDQVADCQSLLSSLQKEIPYQCVADRIELEGVVTT